MLENIKSSFFIRTFLLYIKEEKVLNLFKYNKNLQNKIGINLINYKIFSGKYIVYETNTRAKIYNAYNDGLLFEGEFLNGKRNGKGKEYDNYGKIKFEGEYKDGKRNGKGEEYDFYGKLLSEGEYLNGKKWNVKIKKNLNNVVYELKEGKGYIVKDYDYDYEGLKYEGEYLNGERNGKGREYFMKYDTIFEGEYLNGKRWNVIQYNKDKKIIYKLVEGKGKIKELFPIENLEIEVEYLNGERNGKGKAYSEKSLIFEGEYKNGKRNGKGKEFDKYHISGIRATNFYLKKKGYYIS